MIYNKNKESVQLLDYLYPCLRLRFPNLHLGVPNQYFFSENLNRRKFFTEHPFTHLLWIYYFYFLANGVCPFISYSRIILTGFINLLPHPTGSRDLEFPSFHCLYVFDFIHCVGNMFSLHRKAESLLHLMHQFVFWMRLRKPSAS